MSDEQPKPAATNGGQEDESPFRKFNAPVLKGIESSDGDLGAARALFLPTNFAEAMELSKLMASGLMVPPHLRGKPGDCLAILTQAARWGMDPFSVAAKSYFVNDRMAYEGQLVAAVVNSSNVLQGRLKVDWHGDGEQLRCSVRGRIKGDEREHAVEQDLRTIKVRNSPLWLAAPRQQIGYYTIRLWARLYTPEVLLGVYTVDEVQMLAPAADVGSVRARPSRSDFKGDDVVDGEFKPAGERIDPATGEILSDDGSLTGLTSDQMKEAIAAGISALNRKTVAVIMDDGSIAHLTERQCSDLAERKQKQAFAELEAEAASESVKAAISEAIADGALNSDIAAQERELEQQHRETIGPKAGASLLDEQNQQQSSGSDVSHRSSETPAADPPPKVGDAPEASSNPSDAEQGAAWTAKADMEKAARIVARIYDAKDLDEVDKILSMHADIIPTLDATAQKFIADEAEGGRVKLREKSNG